MIIGYKDKGVIEQRLKEYANRTKPVFEYLQKDDLSIKEIDGNQSVAQVFQNI